MSAQKKRQKAWKHTKSGVYRQFDPSVRIPVDYSKLNTGNSWGPSSSAYKNGYYEDMVFYCRDCGKKCVWIAEDQQWWYEVMQGYIDSIACRCLPCRVKMRERKAEARRLWEEGMLRKKMTKANSV
ncbi:MAG: zinc-ribbon domain-containing protein [Azoarcus sp.]|nr:zinc-ribbon domain-containing protein [Azoarcus sp.]